MIEGRDDDISIKTTPFLSAESHQRNGNTTSVAMPGLIQLPSEILHHIVSYTDRKECKELGLTCSLLRDISKEWFFRSATLSPYKWDRFEELLANRHLSQFVTKVYVDISDWNAVS